MPRLIANLGTQNIRTERHCTAIVIETPFNQAIQVTFKFKMITRDVDSNIVIAQLDLEPVVCSQAEAAAQPNFSDIYTTIKNMAHAKKDAVDGVTTTDI